jgi:hypothetical protein
MDPVAFDGLVQSALLLLQRQLFVHIPYAKQGVCDENDHKNHSNGFDVDGWFVG